MQKLLKKGTVRVRCCRSCMEAGEKTCGSDEPAGLTVTKRGAPVWYCEDCGSDWAGEWTTVAKR